MPSTATKPGGILTVFGLLPNLLAARIGFARAMTSGGSGLGRRRPEEAAGTGGRVEEGWR